jgi:hypothetical protein
MNDFQSMDLYLSTSLEAMQALDDERRNAEMGSVDARVWNGLAMRYDAQGRPAQAGSCRRRAEHYAGLVTSVSLETEAVEYA